MDWATRCVLEENTAAIAECWVTTGPLIPNSLTHKIGHSTVTWSAAALQALRHSYSVKAAIVCHWFFISFLVLNCTHWQMV